MGDNFTRISIVKLHADGSNWVNFWDCMTWHLGARDWLMHLSELTTSETYTAASDINSRTLNQQWQAEEKLVKNIITSCVPDQIFASIKNKPSIMEVWNTIKALYQNWSQMIIVDLEMKLWNTKLGEKEDVCAHFAKLQDLQEQLSSVRHSISNDKYSSILLSTLPAPYKIIMGSMSAASHSTGNSISPEHVIQMACDEYDRLVLKLGKNNSEDAFGASTQRQCDKKNIECYNCHKLGHYKSDCWAKGGDKEGQHPPQRTDNNQNSDNQNNRGWGNGNKCNQNNNRHNNDSHQAEANSAPANIEAWAAIKEIDKDDPASYMFTPSTAFTTDHFPHQPKAETKLYDSEASSHMSPFWDQFISYHAIPPHPITAANKHIFYAIGAGDLQIDVPNGDTTTPILLHNTLHTPDMALTIVSIGCITSTGNTVQSPSKKSPA